MDNLTHSLVGLTAARAGLERMSPLATLTCVLAANAPDADIVALAGGPSFYLEHHRGITHSLVGTFALGLLLPALVWGCERLYARRRGRAPAANFKGLLICSLLLAASHPLLDWTNSYGVRPWQPWDSSWYYGDLVFIMDPYLWLVLGGAAFLASPGRGWRVSGWALLAVALSAALVWLPGRAGLSLPAWTYAVWFGGLCLAAAARLLKKGGRWGGAVPATALAFVVIYWGALSVFHRRAFEAAREAAEGLASGRGERVQRVAAMPTLADPTVWLCAAETDAATFRYELTLGRPTTTEELGRVLRVEKPPPSERPLLAEAESDERVRVLLDFARFPVVRLGRNCAGETVARFADLRYTAPGETGRGGNFSVEVPVSGGR
ncbi:MAG TPA: metal-dependent hydrolase [Pyrinomonadaceae bacterium]|nr:metal-dependent hydrolase [Pyrinomonadaceae bacterium]